MSALAGIASAAGGAHGGDQLSGRGFAPQQAARRTAVPQTLGASDNLHRRELARDWTLLSNESSNGALCWNDTASAFAGTSCTAANLILDNASAPVYCLDNPNFLLYCPVDRRSVASPFVWQPGVSPSVPLTLDNTCYNSKAIAVSETYPSCTAATIARGGDVGSPCFNPQRPDAYEFYCPTAYDQRWSGPPPPPAAVLAPFTNSSGLLCFRTEALVRAYTVCGIVPGHPLYALGFGAFGGNAKSGYPCGGEFPWFCDTSRAPSEAPNVQFCYETRSQAEGDCFGALMLRLRMQKAASLPCPRPALAPLSPSPHTRPLTNSQKRMSVNLL